MAGSPMTTGVNKARLIRSSKSQQNRNVPETKENRKRSMPDKKKLPTIYVPSYEDFHVPDEAVVDSNAMTGIKKARLSRPSNSQSEYSDQISAENSEATKPRSQQIQPNEEHVMNLDEHSIEVATITVCEGCKKECKNLLMHLQRSKSHCSNHYDIEKLKTEGKLKNTENKKKKNALYIELLDQVF